MTICFSKNSQNLFLIDFLQIQPILLGKHVNTYTFTKSLAEILGLKETQGMPFAIVRPSGGKINKV
jgi:hypothetical protein